MAVGEFETPSLCSEAISGVYLTAQLRRPLDEEHIVMDSMSGNRFPKRYVFLVDMLNLSVRTKNGDEDGRTK